MKPAVLTWVAVLLSSGAMPAYKDCQRAVRDDRWKLIRYPLVDRTQLFDLGADPHEFTSLADQPEQAARLGKMTVLLEGEMARYDDPAPLNVARPRPAEWTPPAPRAGATKSKPKAQRGKK
jgi:arylsulfatase A-like enzyme